MDVWGWAEWEEGSWELGALGVGAGRFGGWGSRLGWFGHVGRKDDCGWVGR